VGDLGFGLTNHAIYTHGIVAGAVVSFLPPGANTRLESDPLYASYEKILEMRGGRTDKTDKVA
jgi:hypothetical protein